jgi:hypothetical protein
MITLWRRLDVNISVNLDNLNLGLASEKHNEVVKALDKAAALENEAYELRQRAEAIVLQYIVQALITRFGPPEEGNIHNYLQAAKDIYSDMNTNPNYLP